MSRLPASLVVPRSSPERLGTGRRLRERACERMHAVVSHAGLRRHALAPPAGVDQLEYEAILPESDDPHVDVAGVRAQRCGTHPAHVCGRRSKHFPVSLLNLVESRCKEAIGLIALGAHLSHLFGRWLGRTIG